AYLFCAICCYQHSVNCFDLVAADLCSEKYADCQSSANDCTAWVLCLEHCLVENFIKDCDHIQEQEKAVFTIQVAIAFIPDTTRRSSQQLNSYVASLVRNVNKFVGHVTEAQYVVPKLATIIMEYL
ncbi:hypothetical protein CSKR_108193, partial [Clonorchis sinensis]